MPEIGFDDEPMRPTMRLATVTKKKPKTTISRPSSSLLPIPGPGTNGSSAMTTTSTAEPTSTNVIGRSRSVRAAPPAVAARAAPPGSP